MSSNPINTGSMDPPRMPSGPPPAQHERGNAYKIFQDIFRGGASGAIVTMVLNPGIYAVNMASAGKDIIWRNSYRGTSLMGVNVIPQVALQIMTYNTMKRALFPNEENDELSFGKEIICAGGAAVVSSIVTVPGEQIVLNYQNNKNTLSMRQIAAKTYRMGGFRRVFNGGTALAGREWIWILAYKSLSERMTLIYKKQFKNALLCEVLGAGTVGLVGGVVTTLPNSLRIKKQNQALLPGKPQSYRHFLKNIFVEAGRKELINAAKIRGPFVAVACILMTQSGKLFEEKT